MPSSFSKTHKLLFILLTSLCCACYNKSQIKVIDTLKELDRSIVACNAVMADNNKMIMDYLDNGMVNPGVKEKMALWQPKAKFIYNTSTNLVSFIESLKTGVKNESGSTQQGIEKFHGDNMDAVTRYFISGKKGNDLFDSLKKYKEGIPQIDAIMYTDLKYKLPFLSIPIDTRQSSGEEFTKAVFADIPAQSAVAILSRFQSSILLTEKMMMEYCNAKIAWDHPHEDFVSFITCLSSSSVRPGEEIKISAGLGTFSTAAQPQITINGKKVPVESYGLTEYTMKAAEKPGDHKIMVTCAYIDQDGIKNVIEKIVIYKVTE